MYARKGNKLSRYGLLLIQMVGVSCFSKVACHLKRLIEYRYCYVCIYTLQDILVIFFQFSNMTGFAIVSYAEMSGGVRDFEVIVDACFFS